MEQLQLIQSKIYEIRGQKVMLVSIWRKCMEPRQST